MLEKIKNQFPIFEKNPNLVFLDTAASALKPKSVINSIDPKITLRIWKAIIWSYVDFQKRNYKKK